MNCEEATHLISAHIDGESAGDVAAALDAHLAACGACRQTLTEIELSDAALLRAFSPRREAATELANRVSQALSNSVMAPAPPAAGKFTQSLIRWTGFIAAAAAGFVAAIVFVKPARPRPVTYNTPAPVESVQSVARLTLATGAVYTCPANQQTWTPIALRDPIAVGASVRTAQSSKCELQLPDGSCVRLNASTEACFIGDRALQLSCGQVCTALPSHAATLRITAGASNVTACGAPNDSGTAFDLSCAANSATVTVERGNAEVAGNGSTTLVHGGQVLESPSRTGVYACREVPDPVLAARWQDDLLLLKPGNDPEVIARVDALMSRIASERGPVGAPGAIEQEFRARGQDWCSSTACYIRTRTKDGDVISRQIAAGLLADLAPPSRIPDLIGLLDDDSDQIRAAGFAALRRLTGQSLGFSQVSCATPRDPAVSAAWREWWKKNKSHYPAQD